MSPGPALASCVAYSGGAGSVQWEGRSVKDPDQFRQYLRDVVQPRISDAESSFDAELGALATTGMDTRFIARLLGAVPHPRAWEVGEALAECLLRDEQGRTYCWPWNSVRDRRAPRSSLPGADLVGFYREDGCVFLLFGEVKTSSDVRTPPPRYERREWHDVAARTQRRQP